MEKKNNKIIILAAGKGTRMNSDLPKALVPLNDKPIVEHLLQAIKDSKVNVKPILVVSPDNKEIIQEALNKYGCEYAIQAEQLGTGHATSAACGLIDEQTDKVITFYGDHPFVKPATIKKLFEIHKGVITMITAEVKDFNGWRRNFLHWGRVVRNKQGEIEAIIEFKDATEEQKEIKEVNPSFFCFDGQWLKANIKKLKNNNNSGEYYLTDMVKLAFQEGHKVNDLVIDAREVMGINSVEELEIAEKLMKRK